MVDRLGREITYMRISLTDRCNLRCRYCMPEALPALPHEHILRYEEILRIVKAAVALGITHFRVTGGEPFVRKDVLTFLARLKAQPGVKAVTLTTNGLHLTPHIPALKAMGLDGVNISLDTLNPDTYIRITGQDKMAVVLEAIRASVDAGLKTKVNCVPMAGVNLEDVTGLAALAEQMPVDIRFIELMPTGAGQGMTFIPGPQVRALLAEAYPDLEPTYEQRGFGPARYYQSRRLKGRLGFIDALSGHFCAACNRVRLTSEGDLKLCLYHEEKLSLRTLLRNGQSDKALLHAIEEGIMRKPKRHFFESTDGSAGIKAMVKIGG